jgi:hypothetical protein
MSIEGTVHLDGVLLPIQMMVYNFYATCFGLSTKIRNHTKSEYQIKVTTYTALNYLP